MHYTGLRRTALGFTAIMAVVLWQEGVDEEENYPREQL
jgi:hypothetical protein